MYIRTPLFKVNDGMSRRAIEVTIYIEVQGA
jgi:hypothetical protein